MIREDLRNFEPKIYRILENALKNGRLSHFYLLCGDSPLVLDAAFLLAQSIIADSGDFADEESETAKRIRADNYFDFCYIDGSKKSILKDDIEAVYRRLDKTALERANKKVFIINEIQNASNKVWNMLLKNIEEPRSGIYAIMVTSAIDSLLETIKSRSQILTFKEADPDYLLKTYKEYGHDDLDAYYLSRISKRLKDIKSDDEAFVLAKEVTHKVISELEDVDHIEIIYQKEVYEPLKNKPPVLKDFVSLHLRLLKTYLDDCLICDCQIASYREEIELLKRHDTARLLQVVLDILRKSDYNYDKKLLLDEMAYRFSEVIKGE